MSEILLDRRFDRIYPAGEPLPESGPHEIVRSEVAAMLRQFFGGRVDVWVASNRNVYFAEGAVREVVEPDVMVVMGVSVARLDRVASYRTWQHGGVIGFVLEVASQETQQSDDGHKRDVYARIGVAEYWRLDPTGGELRAEVLAGERLVDGNWRPIDVAVDPDGVWSGRSASLGLDIVWGDDEVLLSEPGSDRPLHNLARAEAARRQAEETLGDAEAARRAAEQQAAALLAELEKLKEEGPDGQGGASSDGSEP